MKTLTRIEISTKITALINIVNNLGLNVQTETLGTSVRLDTDEDNRIVLIDKVCNHLEIPNKILDFSGTIGRLNDAIITNTHEGIIVHFFRGLSVTEICDGLVLKLFSNPNEYIIDGVMGSVESDGVKIINHTQASTRAIAKYVSRKLTELHIKRVLDILDNLLTKEGKFATVNVGDTLLAAFVGDNYEPAIERLETILVKKSPELFVLPNNQMPNLCFHLKYFGIDNVLRISAIDSFRSIEDTMTLLKRETLDGCFPVRNGYTLDPDDKLIDQVGGDIRDACKPQLGESLGEPLPSRCIIRYTSSGTPNESCFLSAPNVGVTELKDSDTAKFTLEIPRALGITITRFIGVLKNEDERKEVMRLLSTPSTKEFTDEEKQIWGNSIKRIIIPMTPDNTQYYDLVADDK